MSITVPDNDRRHARITTLVSQINENVVLQASDYDSIRVLIEKLNGHVSKMESGEDNVKAIAALLDKKWTAKTYWKPSDLDTVVEVGFAVGPIVFMGVKRFGPPLVRGLWARATTNATSVEFASIAERARLANPAAAEDLALSASEETGMCFTQRMAASAGRTYAAMGESMATLKTTEGLKAFGKGSVKMVGGAAIVYFAIDGITGLIDKSALQDDIKKHTPTRIYTWIAQQQTKVLKETLSAHLDASETNAEVFAKSISEGSMKEFFETHPEAKEEFVNGAWEDTGTKILKGYHEAVDGIINAASASNSLPAPFQDPKSGFIGHYVAYNPTPKSMDNQLDRDSGGYTDDDPAWPTQADIIEKMGKGGETGAMPPAVYAQANIPTPSVGTITDGN